ncbi:DUF302 domain-containing protein [Nisaea acidiphila]|uniref:DUF302 domain-containing protein n=1 Tax=Nisaea acidiphila TaxID=1862145 RepID=A0A9J7ASF5_9PROT|nr:DUF302 domain-containing protein [Nisaea acidiphila]UUX48261.1 DUF302 domain-containing protein [Nisaea acidiphila]
MNRILAALVAFLLLAGADASTLRAAVEKPYSGTLTVETGKPFGPFVKSLPAAIKQRGMNIVGIACATCAAKSQGVTVPGNRVFFFFKPAYAVRMLAASEAAGIEAPIRIYVTEAGDGTAKVTYRLPSHVFGAYEVPALDELGAELDEDVRAILEIAKSGSGG